MRTRLDPGPKSSRLPRAWVRLALTSVVAAGTCAVAVAVLLEEDEDERSRRHVVGNAQPTTGAVSPTSRDEVDAPQGAALPPRAPALPPPSALREVFRRDTLTTAPSELASWVTDARLTPPVRYAALRRLEDEAPAEAVAVALHVLTDTTQLVRLNAIALLARSQDPRAVEALTRLDERSRRLASQLARR